MEGQGMHLANVVRADGGDGLERQLLAAHAHEDLLHLAQEILSGFAAETRQARVSVVLVVHVVVL